MNELTVIEGPFPDAVLLAPSEAEMRHWLACRIKPSVYFIECVGHSLVKIGVSDDPARRVDELQTASPFELLLIHAIPGDMKLERLLHYAFRLQRFRGEWFHLAGPVDAFIDATWRHAEIEASGRSGIPLWNALACEMDFNSTLDKWLACDDVDLRALLQIIEDIHAKVDGRISDG